MDTQLFNAASSSSSLVQRPLKRRLQVVPPATAAALEFILQ